MKTEQQIIDEMCITIRKDYAKCTPEKQWAIKQWMTWLIDVHKEDIASLVNSAPKDNINISVKKDAVWICFCTNDDKKAMLHLNNIVSTKIHSMANDIIEKAISEAQEKIK